MLPSKNPHNSSVILHLSTEMPLGGGEIQLLYLYKGLAEKGIQQLIICSEGSQLAEQCRKRHYNYLTLKRRGGFSFQYAWELKNLLKSFSKKQTIWTIHCHDAHAHTHAVLADILLLHRQSLPLIISRKVVPSPRKKVINWLKYRYPSIKKVICVSQAAADVCSQWADPKKITILHDTLDLRDYFPPEAHCAFTIGIIASLIPVKNHELFLKCAQKILLSALPIHFWIIGEGPLRPELENQAKQLNIASQIKFFGFREDIPFLLSQLDILLVTSKNEGLCSVILQAMGAQVPVIAHNVGGIPEIIQHEKNGMLANNEEDFVRYSLEIYHNSSLKKQLSQNALDFVKDYDLPIFVEKMLKIYGDLKE